MAVGTGALATTRAVGVARGGVGVGGRSGRASVDGGGVGEARRAPLDTSESPSPRGGAEAAGVGRPDPSRGQTRSAIIVTAVAASTVTPMTAGTSHRGRRVIGGAAPEADDGAGEGMGAAGGGVGGRSSLAVEPDVRAGRTGPGAV